MTTDALLTVTRYSCSYHRVVANDEISEVMLSLTDISISDVNFTSLLATHFYNKIDKHRNWPGMNV